MNYINYNIFKKNNRILICTTDNSSLVFTPFYFEVRQMNNQFYLYIPSITDISFIHSVLNNNQIIFYYEYPINNNIFYYYGNATANASSCDFDFVNNNITPEHYQLRLTIDSYTEHRILT